MTRLILWPFALVWHLTAGILLLAGRFVAILVGLIFTFVGVVLTMTFIGAIVGIPLIVTGWQLVRLGLS